MHNTLTDFDNILKRYSNIYVIISPPRCGSTAFARVFWEHPTVGYYSHEPFEVTYYKQQDLGTVANILKNPLKLTFLQSKKAVHSGSDLVIKEMPYQAGDHFPLLISWAKRPIIFLIRDPRLNIASRVEKKLETGDNPVFPWIETGWELISKQITYCQRENIPYIIVDATDFRNYPKSIFQQVFERFDLPFSDTMLSWQPCPNVDLDNLGGDHTHLYRKVLVSQCILPPTESIKDVQEFSEENGLRDHVKQCMNIYSSLLTNSNRISAIK